MFYVYLHKTESGRLFYVGKGKCGRAYSKENRSQHWKNTVLKHGLCVEIVSLWENESDAFAEEIRMISYYKSIGVSLCNKTAGGEGVSGYKFNEEQRRKISDALKGSVPPNKGKKTGPLSDETKLKLSAIRKGRVSPNKGRKMSDSAKLKISDAFKGRPISESHKASISKGRKGFRWISNGESERCVSASAEIAEGWKLGRFSAERAREELLH